MDAINTHHQNTVHLPGHTTPPSLRGSTDLLGVVAASEVLLVVVPTQYIVKTLACIGPVLRPDHVLVSCSKGITLDTLETVDEVLARRVVPPGHPAAGRLAFLSGPSFAAEVAAGQPAAVTVAAADESLAQRVQQLLSTPCFRCYRSTDVPGVEMGGALKNVLAIACGISDGLGFGNNARAALITRGLYEITKLAVAKGANPLTMSGLAGMGDLVLTCTGDLSRNRTVGLRLGRGETLQQIHASMGGSVAEGVPTAAAVHALARRMGVDCPIMEGIYRVIHESADPRAIVTEVMSRDLKPEVAPDIIQGVIANGGPGATPTKHGGNTPLKGSSLELTAMAAGGTAAGAAARTEAGAEAEAAAGAVATLPPAPRVALTAGGAGTAAFAQSEKELQQPQQRQGGGVCGAGWELPAVCLLAGAVVGAVLTRLAVSRST